MIYERAFIIAVLYYSVPHNFKRLLLNVKLLSEKSLNLNIQPRFCGRTQQNVSVKCGIFTR